jgi:uncharacterized protein (TIGR00299 family) protein
VTPALAAGTGGDGGHRIGWLDCTSGVSGDMLLGALVDLGVPLAELQRTVDALRAGPIRLEAGPARREGVAATRVEVRYPTEDLPRRGPADVARLLAAADLAPSVRDRATAVFDRMARAEAAAHGTDDVHFHEVGALDALADVVGVVAGFATLELHALYCGAVATGSGVTTSEHGQLTVPAPAVLQLLRDAGAPATFGGPPVELATPTGVALLVELVDVFGAPPPLRPEAAGRGAGSREVPDRPNVVSLIVGTSEPQHSAPAEEGADGGGGAVLLAANVDDLDPRLWPAVIGRLLAAGAVDAWLTPIVMKKGRPAHTVQALSPPAAAEAVRRALHRETTTIGARSWSVRKHALTRREATVEVAGCPVRVKVASLDGEVLTATPEYDDVAAAAERAGLPVRLALDAAVAAVEAAGLSPAVEWRGETRTGRP